jgi:hypothetical protein
MFNSYTILQSMHDNESQLAENFAPLRIIESHFFGSFGRPGLIMLRVVASWLVPPRTWVTNYPVVSIWISLLPADETVER